MNLMKSIKYRLQGGAYGEAMNKKAMQKPDVAQFYKTHKGMFGMTRGVFEITGKVVKTAIGRALGLIK